MSGSSLYLVQEVLSLPVQAGFSEAEFRRPDKVHSKRYPFISVFLYPIHLRYFLGVGTLLASHLQKAELEQILVIGGDVRWSWPSAHFLQGISCAGCRVINLSSCL